MEQYDRYNSPVGELILVSEGEKLTGLWLAGTRTLSPAAVERENPVLEQTVRWLDRYFAGAEPDPGELPLKPEGTDFRKMIWQLLLGIPYGTTVTYGSLAGEIAARLGRKNMSAQAVGGAVGANPIWIVIPCHRVVGADGSLTGYAGGLEMKAKLLRIEGANTGSCKR